MGKAGEIVIENSPVLSSCGKTALIPWAFASTMPLA
jgi:hypothetical protein